MGDMAEMTALMMFMDLRSVYARSWLRMLTCRRRHDRRMRRDLILNLTVPVTVG